MDLLIVGAGRMGRWFARTVVDHADGPVSVAFADLDPAAAEAAAEAVGGRTVPLDPADGSRSGEAPAEEDPPEAFDAVCVAVPIPAAPDAIREHAPRARRAVLDVTGVMEPAVEAAREAAPDRERLSLHPLFAPGRAPDNVAAVPDRSGPTVGRIRAALVAAGNEVVETTPRAHDRAMETVQAKAHAAVLAFALAADPVPREFATPVMAGLADVVATVTGDDPDVYAEIQAAFDGAGEVAAAAEEVAAAAADAQAGDPAAFRDLYRAAGRPVIEEGGLDEDGGNGNGNENGSPNGESEVEDDGIDDGSRRGTGS